MFDIIFTGTAVGVVFLFFVLFLYLCSQASSSWAEECEYCGKTFVVSDKPPSRRRRRREEEEEEGGERGREDSISTGEWQAHVERCLDDLRTKLSSEPEEVGLRCPLCTGKITLAVHQEIHKFYCQAGDPPCPASLRNARHEDGRAHRFANDGLNCFACVPCEYTLCAECVKRRVRGVRRRREMEEQERTAENENAPNNVSPSAPNAPPPAQDSSTDAPPPSYDEVLRKQQQQQQQQQQQRDEQVLRNCEEVFKRSEQVMLLP